MKKVYRKIQIFVTGLFLLWLCLTPLFAADQQNNSSFTGNVLLFQGNFVYSSYDTDYLSFSDRDAYGWSVEHQSRLTRTSELVLSIEQTWFRDKLNLKAHQLLGYKFSWRYHIPYFIYRDIYSMYFNLTWGIYDLKMLGANGSLRTGAWSIGLGNRFYLGSRFIVQLDMHLRNIQFWFPDNTTQKETIDSFYVSLGLGLRYLKW